MFRNPKISHSKISFLQINLHIQWTNLKLLYIYTHTQVTKKDCKYDNKSTQQLALHWRKRSKWTKSCKSQTIKISNQNNNQQIMTTQEKCQISCQKSQIRSKSEQKSEITTKKAKEAETKESKPQYQQWTTNQKRNKLKQHCFAGQSTNRAEQSTGNGRAINWMAWRGHQRGEDNRRGVYGGEWRKREMR